MLLKATTVCISKGPKRENLASQVIERYRHHVTQNTKIPTSLKENIWPGCQRNAMVIMNVALLFTNNWDSAFIIFLCFALSVYNIFFFLARMHCTVFTDVDWAWERGDYVCMEVTVNSTPNLYILYLHIQYIFYVFGPNGLLEKKKKNTYCWRQI